MILQGRTAWDIAFRHPFMPRGPLSHNSPMTTLLLQFFAPQLGEVTHGSFCLFLSSGEPLNKRRKHLFWEYKICPRRSFSGLEAIDMAKKYPHTDTQCFPLCPKLTHENRPVRPPPLPPPLCFHKAGREQEHKLVRHGQQLL